MALPRDFTDLLRAFGAAEVHYLLVGGYAVSFHAVPRFTKDIDLWIDPSEDNLERAVAALAHFGAPTSAVDALRSSTGLDVVWMGRPPMRIDLMKEIPGVVFEEAWPRRVSTSWDGVSVTIIGREDLIRAKRASGRELDLIDATTLERTKA